MANLTHGDLKALMEEHFEKDDVMYTVCQDGEAPAGIYFYGKYIPQNWGDFVNKLTASFSLKEYPREPTVQGNGKTFTCFGRFWR